MEHNDNAILRKEGVSLPQWRKWAVLVALMLVTFAVEMQWLSHAAVSRPAAAYYAGQFDPASLFSIDFLAIVYMLAYLVFCIPASWVIDRFGLAAGVGIGAALVLAGGLGKGLWGHDFAAQIVFQAILAIAQPFIINAPTAMSVRWFPVSTRATATGLAALAQYLGFAAAMICMPLLVQSDPDLPGYGTGMDTALGILSVLSVIAAAVALVFVRDPPGFVRLKGAERLGLVRGFAALLKNRDMLITLVLFFLGLGIMNAVTSLIDGISGSIGVRDSDGLLGVCMIAGGVAGAIVMPILSDRFRKRKAILIVCMAGLIPGIAGLSFTGLLNPYSYEWKVVSTPGEVSVNLKTQSAHPAFLPPENGRYVFEFRLSDKNGNTLESATIDIEAKQGGMLLLDGTRTDDGIVASSYLIALIAAGLLGFSVMSAGPIGFQYAAEVTAPVSESYSQGLLLLAGQISGMIFTAIMSVNNNEHLAAMLVVFFAASLLMLGLTSLLREPLALRTNSDTQSA